jgi:hydroxymethylbilane synthase
LTSVSKTLEGGCTAPIGALARYNEKEDNIHFQGVLFSLDGKEKIEVDKVVPIEEWKKLGFFSAQEVLNNGGTKLMMEIKKQFEEIMSQTSILSTKTLSDVQRQAFLDANFDL